MLLLTSTFFYFILWLIFLFLKVWLFNFFVPIWIFCFYGKIKLTYLLTYFPCFLLISPFRFITSMKLFLVSSIFFNLNSWRFLQARFQSNYIFSIRPRIFDISIDSSFFKYFFIFILLLLQIIERTVFPKMYGILRFWNFLYLPQITQYNFFILTFLVNGNNLEKYFSSLENKFL